MLRIILGILKLIGILLAAILLLILAILLIVLVTPLRYRGTVEKTAEKTMARIRVSWFFRFISVAFSFDLQEKQKELVIRICGIRLDSILACIRKAAAGLQRIRNRKMLPETETFDTKDSDTKDSETVTSEMEDAETEISDADFIRTEMVENDMDSISDSDPDPEESPEISEQEAEEPETVPNQKKRKKKKEKPEKVKGKKSLEERIQNISELLQAKISDVGHLIEKISRIPEQISDYANLAEEYEVKAVLGCIFREIHFLLKKYLPRKMTGYIHFGLTDPAATGKLTGLLYMIRPSGASAFRIEPEFNETLFETEATFVGRIRPCHVIGVALRLLLNRKLIRLIKKILSLRKKNKR